MMAILWVKTKGEKGESGFSVESLENAVERFISHKSKWDQIQANRHEKPYTFSAKYEDDDGVIMPWKDFKKLV